MEVMDDGAHQALLEEKRMLQAALEQQQLNNSLIAENQRLQQQARQAAEQAAEAQVEQQQAIFPVLCLSWVVS